jgi:hypothetical protein
MHSVRLSLRLLSLSLAGLGLAACGASVPAVRVTSPTTPAELRVFDHGVDLVDDPEILAGQWRESWGEELQTRVGGSDVIELVRVNSAQATRIPDRGASYRLDIEPDRALFGEAVDVDLLSTEGEGGYVSVDRNQTRLLSTDFVLFIKWYQAEDGTIAAHWHLSPATPAVVQRITFLVDRRVAVPVSQQRRTVYEN